MLYKVWKNIFKLNFRQYENAHSQTNVIVFNYNVILFNAKKTSGFHPLAFRFFLSKEYIVLIFGFLNQKKGDVATLWMMPRPISFLILKALYQGFQKKNHLFLDSFWKRLKIWKTGMPKNI